MANVVNTVRSVLNLAGAREHESGRVGEVLVHAEIPATTKHDPAPKIGSNGSADPTLEEG
jgi:hypothetical protein